MEDKTFDPDGIRIFKPFPPELEARRITEEIYKSHFKKIRTFLWVALIVISVLFYWYGENGRYQHTKDYQMIDTKTGKYYWYHEGKWVTE